MEKKLKTVVLISPLPTIFEATVGMSAAIPGLEATSVSSSRAGQLKIETLDLLEGERAELASEKETVAVGIAMPFTLIEPKATPASAADQEDDNWGIATMGAENLGLDAGAGVKVAVLDTGINPAHEAFSGLDPIQKNFTQGPDDDQHGHGTHCAGTIFGQDVGGQRIGIARGVRRPLIAKVLGEGGGDSASIMEAISWAQQEKADIISMSLGIDFPKFQRDLMASGMQEIEATSIALQAYRENVRLFDQLSRLYSVTTLFKAPLLIAAAGNESERPNFTIAAAPPAVADDILSVAAIDAQQKVAYFSNTLADCCGPGVNILSADHADNGGLKLLSGTSMATPHVAGAAAIAAAELMQMGAARFTPRDLREAVLAKAQPVPGLTRADVGRGKIMVRRK